MVKRIIVMLFVALLVIGSTANLEARGGRRGYVLASRSGVASWHDYSRDRTVKRSYRNANIVASRSYPCGTVLKVFNKSYKRRHPKSKHIPYVFVTVRDWGPARWTGRNLDLNKPAFREIANTGSGEIKVTYYVVKMGKCKIHNH
jgi:rare lipoprotein A (peptidoglycan hydrolase)